MTTLPADSSTTDDPSADDTTTGARLLPLPDPAWITPLQEELGARLYGATELSPGIFLPNRATLQNRSTALVLRWA